MHLQRSDCERVELQKLLLQVESLNRTPKQLLELRKQENFPPLPQTDHSPVLENKVDKLRVQLNTLVRKNNLQEAQHSFEEAVKKFPDNHHSICYQFIDILVENKCIHLAKEVFEKQALFKKISEHHYDFADYSPHTAYIAASLLYTQLKKTAIIYIQIGKTQTASDVEKEIRSYFTSTGLRIKLEHSHSQEGLIELSTIPTNAQKPKKSRKKRKKPVEERHLEHRT